MQDNKLKLYISYMKTYFVNYYLKFEIKLKI